jgi:hypothetical protein
MTNARAAAALEAISSEQACIYEAYAGAFSVSTTMFDAAMRAEHHRQDRHAERPSQGRGSLVPRMALLIPLSAGQGAVEGTARPAVGLRPRDLRG